MNMLDSQQVTIDCPGCGHKLKQPLGRLKTTPTLHCPQCSRSVEFDATALQELVVSGLGRSARRGQLPRNRPSKRLRS